MCYGDCLGTYISPAETELYYLQSRYYNPEIGRFINADRYVSRGKGLLGYNMFAYCNNNPVKFLDYCGDVLETCLEDADPTNDFMEDVMGGGGGISSSINANGKTINFGHGGRHLKGTGLDTNKVNQALADKVSKLDLCKGEFYKGRLVMNGITLEYTSYGLGSNVINVGTYYPVCK